MALRAGELMVVIRAQDFASRTLRRVGAEFEGMSRAERIAMTSRQVAARKATALTRVAIAESDARRLAYVKEGAAMRASLAQRMQALREFQAAQRTVMQGGRFIPGVSPVQRREFQNASAALKRLGMDGVHAFERMAAAENAFFTAQRRHAEAAAAVPAPRVKGRAAAVRAEADALATMQMSQKELANSTRALNSILGRDGVRALTAYTGAQRAVTLAQQEGLVVTKEMQANVARTRAEWMAFDSTAARNIQSWERLNKAVTLFDARLATLPMSLQRAAQGGSAFGNALFRSRQNLAAAYSELDAATKAEMRWNEALRKMPIVQIDRAAHALSGLGRTAQLFGAIGTAVFGGSALVAADFGKSVQLAATQMARIHGGVQLAERQTEQLRDGILKLAHDYPFAAKEMADATYEIFSSTNVQNINEGIALLEAFSRVAVGGQVDLQTATKASITVLNNFRGAGDDVGQTLNRMFSIVRYGRMTFGDFATILPKIAAAAYGSNQSLDDMAGIMSFLTRHTGQASIAATQISRAMDVFSRKEFRDGIRNLGVDIEDATGRMLPLPQVLHKIFAKWGTELQRGGHASERFIQIVTKASNEAGKGFLSTQEARRFFRFLFKNYAEYENLQKLAVANNTQFRIQFERMLKEPGVQWDIFIARIKAGIIAIGNEAIPAFAAIGEEVAKFLDWWESLDKSTRRNIVRWGVFISVGTLVAGVLSSIIGALVSFSIMMSRILVPLGRAIVGFAGLSSLLGGKGAGGLIGRTILFAKVLGFLAAIGTISIGIELTKKGDSDVWKFLGLSLETAGVGALLKKAGMKGAKRIPGAAVLSELIWPSDKITDTAAFQKFTKSIDDMDKTLAGTMKRAKLIKTQREASRIFRTVLEAPTGTFEKARAAVIKYLDSVGVALDDTAEKGKSNVQTFKDWEKALAKATRGAGAKALLKSLGMDSTSLTGSAAAMDAYNAKLKEYRSNVKQYQRDLEEWHKNLADTTRQARVDAVDNLKRMYMDMEQVNRDAFGELFKGPWLTSETFDLAQEWGITPRVKDMIKDLKQQNFQFAKWRTSLDKIFKRGLPRGFIDEIRKMGIEEGQPIIDQLMKATPAQVNQLIAQWKRREGQIKSATKMDFVDEIERFRKAGGDMGAAIIDGFQDAKVGMWFDGWVKSTFPGVINAAVNEAVSRWREGNPPPTAPVRPRAPTLPAGSTTTNPGGIGTRPPAWLPKATLASTTNTQEIHFHDANIGGVERRRINEEALRQAAFVARNALKGAFK